MPPSSGLSNAAERLNLKWKGLAANLAGTLSSEVTDLARSNAGDVLLLGVKGTSFRAHRLVLAAASEFLKTVLLQYPIGEEPVVFLDQMSAETMVDLMDYLYRGQVSLSPRRLDNLIGWGKSLAIKGILELDFNNYTNNNPDPPPPLAHLRPEMVTTSSSSSSAAITPWSSMRSGLLVGSSSWPPSSLLSPPSVSTGLSLLASAALESDHHQVQQDHERQRRFSSSNDENNSLNGNISAINLSLKPTTNSNHYYSEMDNNTTLTIKPTAIPVATDVSAPGFKPVQYHYPKAHLLNIPNPSSLKWKMRAMSAASNSNMTSPSSGIGTQIMDMDQISDVTDEDVLTIDMSSATTPPQDQTNPSEDLKAGNTVDHVGLPATPSPSPSSIGNSLLDPKMIFQTTDSPAIGTNGINYSDTNAAAGLSFGGLANSYSASAGRPVLPLSTATLSNGHHHDELVDHSEMASDLRGSRQNSESLSQSSNGEGKKWKSRQPKLCVHCDRYFSNQFNLKQHILNMHTIGGDVRCDKCNKTVKNKWYLRRHHVTHHNAPLKK
jgi:hypothetical protein